MSYKYIYLNFQKRVAKLLIQLLFRGFTLLLCKVATVLLYLLDVKLLLLLFCYICYKVWDRDGLHRGHDSGPGSSRHVRPGEDLGHPVMSDQVRPGSSRHVRPGETWVIQSCQTR